jgi:MFS family permease
MADWFSPFRSNKNVKNNFIANTADGALYAFGMSFISLNTIMPVFVKKLSGSNIAVGLIPVFWTIGFNFPQIFFANYVRKLPYKKSLLLKTAIGQRIPWLILAILSFFLFESIDSSVALILFFSAFLLAAVAGSINLPGWFDLLAKLTPVQLRGRLFASRSFLGSLLGIAGGITAEKILNSVHYPVSFGILFSATFFLMMISYCFLLTLKEEVPNPPKKELHFLEFFHELPYLLKKNKNFRNFLIADALLITALMADAFYAVNALQKFSLPDSFAGIFTVIVMISIMTGNLLFGFIADKYGHKLTLSIAAVSSVAACIIAVISPSIEIYFFVFVGSASTTTLIQLSRLSIIAELCSEEDRPTYISLTNVLTAPFILSAMAGGWIANSFGYNFVFAAGGLSAFASALWYLTMVEEPRKAYTA